MYRRNVDAKTGINNQMSRVLGVKMPFFGFFCRWHVICFIRWCVEKTRQFFSKVFINESCPTVISAQIRKIQSEARTKTFEA